VQSTGSWVLTVLADPTVTIAAAQTICYNTAGSALTATVTGGSGANTYTWKWGSTTACNDGTSTSTGNTLATGILSASRYYQVMTTQAVSGCASTYSGTVLKTVYPSFSAGAISTASQTITLGTVPNVTIANASSATGGDGNITYQWRRSGTSSAILTGIAATYALSADANSNYGRVGTYYFTRYATHGSCNSTFITSSGQYTLSVLCPSSQPPSSNCDAWTVGSQTWSGALRNPVALCASVARLSTDTYPEPQYKVDGDNYGYYYNWSCVSDAASELCPAPWRVPTLEDVYTLIENLAPGPFFCPFDQGGYCDANGCSNQGATGYFWTTTSYSVKSRIYYVRHVEDEITYNDNVRSNAYTVRCVK
jgi:hypothetical protein